MIGFIGLVVPHLIRLVAGPDHRTLLPASMMAGAILLLLADLLARLALAPAGADRHRHGTDRRAVLPLSAIAGRA